MNIQLIPLFQITFITLYFDQCKAHQIVKTKYFEINFLATIFGTTFLHNQTLELDNVK